MAGAESPQMRRSPQQARRQPPKANFSQRQFDLTQTLGGLLGRLSTASMMERMRIKREIKSMAPSDVEGYKEFGRALAATGNIEALPFLRGGPKGLCSNFIKFQTAKNIGIASANMNSDEQQQSVKLLNSLLKGDDTKTKQEVLSFANKVASENGTSLQLNINPSGSIQFNINPKMTPLAVRAEQPVAHQIQSMTPGPIIHPNVVDTNRPGSNLSSDLSTFIMARQAIFKMHEETRDLRHLRRARTMWLGREEEPDVSIAAPRLSENRNTTDSGLQFNMAPAAPESFEASPLQQVQSPPPCFSGPSPDSIQEFKERIEASPKSQAIGHKPQNVKTVKGAPPKISALPAMGRKAKMPKQKKRAKKGDSMIRDIYTNQTTRIPTFGSTRNISPLMAVSERGEELIRRLMEKMESHGKQKHHTKSEKAPEKTESEKPVKKSKSKPVKSSKKKEVKKTKAAAKKSKSNKKAKKKMLTEKTKAQKKKKAAKKAKKEVKPKAVKKAAKKTTKKAAVKKPAKKPPSKKAKKKTKAQIVNELLRKRKKKK